VRAPHSTSRRKVLVGPWTNARQEQPGQLMARFNPVGLSSNITNDKAPSKRGRFWGMV